MFSIILISCLGIIVYSNTFFCSFHFDDEPFIILNPAIRDIYNLPGIWGYWHGRFVTFLSLALNYHFNGLNVFGYHLFNLGVHLVAAILVWWLTLLTLSTPAMKEEKIARHANIIALFAGLVFVSHPLQTEAVTYIWQRAASMAALFYLASVCFYIKSRLLSEAKPRHGGAASLMQEFFYIGSLITAVVAMFIKENAVTLPLMVLFYEFTFLKTKGSFDWSSFRTLVVTRKYIFPFLLTLFIVPLTLLFSNSEIFQDHHGDLRVPGGVITPMHYFLTQFRVMFTYIRLAFLPINQSLDYDYPIFRSIFEWPVFISLLFLMTIFYLAKCLFSKYRLLSFSIFWFFLTLIIPESSFWVMGDVIMEYRLYLPLVGYSIFLVSGVYYLFGKNNIKTMVVILSLIIACNSVLTYQRNKVWKDESTLWTDAARKSPHKARPFVNRGRFYNNQGNLTQALADYDKAVEIEPDTSVFYFDRGVIYDKQGKFNNALIEYTKAIVINPDYSPSYSNRGEIYAKHGNFTLALVDYSKAIAIDPDFLPAYYNRYQLYYQLKEYDKAWADVHKVEELGYAVDPGFLSALKAASRQDK